MLLAVKLRQGTGCQTCAAGDCWLGASASSEQQHGVSQHISQPEFCHHTRLQPKRLVQREGQRLQNAAESEQKGNGG